LNILPFGSSVDIFDLKGRYLREALENAAKSGTYLLQVSGLTYRVDYSKPVDGRISNVKISVDGNMVDLENDRTYTLAATSFLLQGGDHFTMLKDHKENVR
jgi:2',3'-cyclic-nucleotide 2'-phosphodiesterase (5'-nucleotidase family)